MLRIAVIVLLLLGIHACAVREAPEPGLGDPVSWDALEGWRNDTQAAAWPALLRSCSKISDERHWRDVCRAAEAAGDPTDAEARAFFERYFRPHPVHAGDGARRGLITGYYEPLLRGSFQPSERYRYPLYAPPDDLVSIDLGDRYPGLADQQLRGRLTGDRVVPYPDRAELEKNPALLSGSELLWVDDPYDAFFLHVQGSGRVRLPDGTVVSVGFADHNGRPYRSIGRRLIETGELERGEVDLFTIRRWLREHPDDARRLLNYNPRYIFFALRDEAAHGPTGALNVPLTAGRSLAVDRDAIPLGAPVWLETSRPGSDGEPLNRLMLAQDTGGAIQGPVRADVFWGQGDEAERMAGLMKQPGRMFVLLPKPDAPASE